LKKLGVAVFEPNFLWLEKWNEEEWSKMSDDIKKSVVMGLTYHHWRKIDLADAVFIFNKNGYIGNSVNLEIGYTVARSKPIYVLNKDEELGRQFLFAEIIPSPERLAEVLGYSVASQNKKKITICGSIAFFDEMQKIKEQLETMRHEVKLPPLEIPNEQGEMIPIKEYYRLRKESKTETGWIWDRKALAIRTHFDKIVWADAILVLNYTKNDIENYIGGNTFLEMGVAFHLKKPIYLFNPIPEISSKEEILGMKPIILNGDLSRIEL